LLRYVLRRLLLLPLSLLLLSLLCFGLQQLTPDDAVHRLLPSEDSRMITDDPAGYDRTYRRAAAALGLDRPAFYVSLENAALPDTLHRIARPEERAMLRALTLRTGNWPLVADYHHELRRLAYAPALPDAVKTSARRLLVTDDVHRTLSTLRTLPPEAVYQPLANLLPALEEPGSSRLALLLPALRFHGTDNQYHHWLTKVLIGDFGTSLVDRRPVTGKIWRALRWTALLNGLALLVVFLVSIPLGLYAAGYRNSWFDRVTTAGLFLLFGVPSFWLATLLTNFFTTPAFGMDFFPSMGFGEVTADASFFELLRVRAAHLFLPVMCMAYPSWAYVSRHLRRSAGQEMGQAYVKTARLKGVSHGRLLWGHVLRNASFPIITLLGGIFPALLAGSVLIERIFNLPGMGQLLYNAALASDWPVVVILVLLNGLLTAVGLLVADLGYALADPRVRLGGAQKMVV
jgi:peptide/nickel transport system permease protein